MALPWPFRALIWFCSLVSISFAHKNVLFLLADDGGFEMGAYRNRIVQTPYLDALAKQSLIFNNAYASVSSCSPSRASILTGMPEHQNGMYGLHNGVHNFDALGRVRSISTILGEAGVRTGLIGKKHVGPGEVFKFDYERTEEKFSVNQVGRNITNIKLFVREFLRDAKDNPFFLMVSFHDPHRCGHITPQYGSFCERWGSGEEGMGLIPDWHPIYYVWDELILPYYVPDTEPARRDVAAQYTTISRLDQGIGLVLQELKNAGLEQDTLVVYTSDNGPPLPAARTNLYDPGMAEPMFIRSPDPKSRRNEVTYSMTSHLDLVPTFLDWFNLSYPESNPPNPLTGKSLLPLLYTEPPVDPDHVVFASQSYHEITMAYPMRAVRTKRYKLIHNLNYQLPFPIDQDFFVSPTFQDMLNRTRQGQDLRWYKSLRQYYQRPEWELYDLKLDPAERKNVHGKPVVKEVFERLRVRLAKWQEATEDPFRCMPGGVLLDTGEFENNATCFSLGQ